jgi:uncharacterized protein
VAAWRMARLAPQASSDADDMVRQPHLAASILVGGVIGFVAGVTGIGGGILLAPWMLARKWADARQTTAISSAFNLLNTAAALAGLWLTAPAFTPPPSWWLLAVVCGGAHGSWLAVRALPTWAVRYALAALLVVAGARMLLN